MESATPLKGAEPISVVGSTLGALVLHGFGGTPATVRPLAEVFVNAGWSVESPRLPGHGTSVEDLKTTGWAEWTAEAERAYQALAERASRIVMAGTSMGAALALDLAIRHRSVAGVVGVNPKVLSEPDDTVTDIRGLLEDGMEQLPGGESDVARPGVVELSYPATPLRPLLSMWEGLAALDERLPEASAPLLIFTSVHDHVVPPAESDYLAARWGGPVERVMLEHSFHVATLDHDSALICEGALRFAKRLVG